MRVPRFSRRLVLVLAVALVVGLGAVAAVLVTRSSTARAAGLLAFASYRHGNGDIYVMRSDGSGERRLTHDAGEDLFPVWSPDGKRIAFTRIRGGFACDPETDLLAAAQITRIPFVVLLFGCMPKRLGSVEVYVMNADGSGQHKVGAGLGAVWAPNARRLAYLRLLPKQNSDIYVVGVDGRGQRRLTHSRALEDLPSWSPDGQRLAFDSERVSADSLEHKLYVVNADGSGLRTLTPVSQEGSSEPAWSPDGTKIAFIDWRGAISTISPQGTKARVLRHKTADFSSESDGSPVWSPDGRRIAFVVLNGDMGRRSLSVVNGDGTGLHRSARLQVMPLEKPTWSPDSRVLALTAAVVGGHRQITIVNRDQTNQRAVGSLDAGMPSWQPGGP